METQGLLAEAPWPLNVRSQIFRISLQISGLCYIRGVEVLRGLHFPKGSQRKNAVGMEFLACSWVFFPLGKDKASSAKWQDLFLGMFEIYILCFVIVLKTGLFIYIYTSCHWFLWRLMYLVLFVQKYLFLIKLTFSCLHQNMKIAWPMELSARTDGFFMSSRLHVEIQSLASLS